MKSYLENLPDQSPISRIRRNHGLEHATIHILSKKYPGASMAGHSDAGGFWLFGNFTAEQIRPAVVEALHRMKNGEHNLAVHPNCGTNFATSGAVAGLAGAFAMLGVGGRWRDRLERLPLAISLATMALIFAQPLGFRLQEKITTSGVPGDLEIVDVVPTQRGRVTAHRVITRG